MTERHSSSGLYPVEAIIFDLDGTLIDSEENHLESDKILLARRGIDFTKEEKASFVGKDIREFVEAVVEKYGLAEDVSKVLAEKNAIYREIALKKSRLYPPMRDILEGFRQRKLPMAVATGSNASVGEEILEGFGVRSCFSLFISSAEVERGKPAPDIFLETARQMGADPAHILVFEDTVFGVRAALEAGMGCVALPAPGKSEGEPLFRRADYFVEGGPDVLNPEDFFRWFDTLAARGDEEQEKPVLIL
ncbi:MAG: HAD family phosphatase [Synergistaceae bacterium]|nr:HAD family phosphatase [Synergistaceae bacterium]